MKTKRTAVQNQIMCELVPPELDFLVNRLMQINPADTGRVIEHARKSYTAGVLYRWRTDAHGFKIKGKIRQRAERTPATRGIKDDLRRLLKAAQGGSAKEWQTAWFGVSGEARSLVTAHETMMAGEHGPTSGLAPAIIERQLDDNGKLTGFRRAPLDTRNMKMVNAGKFSAAIPSAKRMLPRIQAALAQGKFLSRREADKLTYIFVLRVRDAYFALTGMKGITFIEGGVVDDGLIALAKDIDRKFGTKVLTVRRLRTKKSLRDFLSKS